MRCFSCCTINKEHPHKINIKAAQLEEAKTKASQIRKPSYSLGKALGHLIEKQQVRSDVMQANNPVLCRAYRLKESLRLLYKLKDDDEAETELKIWLWWASHSRIKSFADLLRNIRRHKEHIINTIRYGLSNVRIEVMNNKIKLIIRKSYGFRNIENMKAIVYPTCSNIRPHVVLERLLYKPSIII